MAAIIIPAHNEAAVIARAIHSIVSQAEPDDEIFVCANGCTDNTQEIANKFRPRVTVLSTARASKTHALNMGDVVATSFPRIYVDADVELSAGCLDKLKRELSTGSNLAVAPKPEMSLKGSTWVVRAYYDIWLSLPYCRQGMIGAGIYALSAVGRRRFDEFPDIIADDGYVRALFNENERTQVAKARVIVNAPANVRWLLKIKTRSRMGQKQLAIRFPELRRNEDKAYLSGISTVLSNPFKWPAAAVYLYVNLVTRILASFKLRKMSSFHWEKDLSSRAADGGKKR